MSVLEFRQSVPQLSASEFCELRRFKVLVIVRNIRQANDVLRHAALMNSPEMQVCFPNTLSEVRDLSLEELYTDCKTIIKEDKVDGVTSLHPLMDTVEYSLFSSFVGTPIKRGVVIK